MNYPGHAAASPWCYPDDAGEAAAAAAAGETTNSFFADMIGNYYFTNDPFDLAWTMSGSGAPGSMTTTQPAIIARSPPAPEVQLDPPSEGEMASWLCAIVNGEGLATDNDDGDVPAAKKPSDTWTTTTDKEKLPLTEGMGSTEQELRKRPAGGSSKRSHTHHGEAHKLTEKRRRHKINERLRTLQQLIPGCDDKSNQAATLDQAIQYMKLLQHHVQAMPNGPTRPPLPAAYNVVPPPAAVPMMPPAAPTMTMVPAMLQLPHYPAPVPVLMPATAAPLYPAAAPPMATAVSASHRHGSNSSKRNGSSKRKEAKYSS
ncbi:unnamed protein product [Urochloa humidicola]